MGSYPKQGKGKSDHSWIKHGMAQRVAGAQVGAFRFRFPDAKIILIDGNAGDGFGVPLDQFDLFLGFTASKPTPRMLADLAEQHGCTLCLCELKRKKREMLRDQFPDAVIVGTHEEAAALATSGDYDYVLWLSDPCGYAGHGVEHMRAVATVNSTKKLPRILRSDFAIIFNELAIRRVAGAKHAPDWQPHQKYTPMIEPAWWLQQLPKRYLARTPVIKQSSGFHFRMMVATDFITNGVNRMRNVEVITRSGIKKSMEA
jgi:hypothetical protein